MDLQGGQDRAEREGEKEKEYGQKAQDRRQPEEDGIRAGRLNELLSHQLQGVRHGLQDPVRPHLERTGTPLDVAGHLPLQVDQDDGIKGHEGGNGHHPDHDSYQFNGNRE